MRTSFHHQPEAQHPKSSSYPQAGRPITPSFGGKADISPATNPRDSLQIRRRRAQHLAECAPTPPPSRPLVERGGHPGPPAYRPCAIAAIRGITIGLSNNVWFLAEELGRRGSSARLAMRGTPFGQPDLPTESGPFIARLSKMERLVWCERPPS